VARLITEQRIIPRGVPGQLLSIGINQQFVMIEPVTLLWLIRAVHPETVLLPLSKSGDVTMPDMTLSFRQSNLANLDPRVIE
jgi:hypothetical protein